MADPVVRAAATPDREPVAVAVLADMLEESWPSMDLVADMLIHELVASHARSVRAVLVRPRLIRLLGHMHGRRHHIPTADRVFNRFWLYRRAIPSAVRAGCRVFHIVDHSYAHLALTLPAGRTIVTCHDADAFRGLLSPAAADAGLPQFLVRRLARGLRRAALVACPSRTTADEMVTAGLVEADRVVVVPNGVAHAPVDGAAEQQIDLLLRAPADVIDLLHVGSTIPRKRVDLLLESFARLARTRAVRLVRVGGAFTPAQESLAARLGIRDRVLVLPFLPRPTLAALYRRVALLLLTSDREGFGLPLVEALAAGVPVVARDLPVLREVAGANATFVNGDDPDAWAARVDRLLCEREQSPDCWRARQEGGRMRARAFSWSRHAASMADLYRHVAERP